MLIAVAGLFFQIAMTMQSSPFMNYASQGLGLNSVQIGWLQSIREVPGLFTSVLAMAAAIFSEGVLSSLCAVLLGIGTLLLMPATGVSTLVLPVVTLSIGFHLFSPIQSAMVLRTAKPGERATRMGWLNSVNAAGAVAASLVVAGLTRYLNFSFQGIFLIAGIFAFVAAGVIFFARRGGEVAARKPMIFRWKYKDYYFLTLLAGARRHVCQTFAALLLVERFGRPTATIVTLMMVANLLAILTRPWLGRIIDKYGEGKALTFNYVVVLALFLGYAFIPSVWLIYAVFIIDNLFFGFEMAITTHLDKIAPRDEVQPTLSMGQTINHISGVAVPTLGGILWKTSGPIATFLMGGAFCLLALWQAARLPAAAEESQPIVAAD